MSPRRLSNRDLDELIDEITVDCYDHDEQLGGFEVAFHNDATFPCPGTVIGQDVEVLSVDVGRRKSVGLEARTSALIP